MFEEKEVGFKKRPEKRKRERGGRCRSHGESDIENEFEEEE